VREVEEPFQTGQKGSSAMPHKRNPILCERVSGLSRIIKANVNVALDNMTLWHERDISHSSSERVILPDSTIALDYILNKMIFVLENLHVYPEAMQENIDRTGGLYCSQSLLLSLIENDINREDAYSIVQDLAMRVWKKEGTLKELVKKDKQISDMLSDNDIEEIFNIKRYFENIDYIFKRLGIIS